MDSGMLVWQPCAPSKKDGDSLTFKTQGKKEKLVMETGLIAQAKMYGKIWCIVLTKKSHKVLYILPGLNTQISTANSLSFSTWDSCPLMNMLHPPTFPLLLATATPLFLAFWSFLHRFHAGGEGGPRGT